MNSKIVLGTLGGIGLITTVSVVSSKSGSSDPSWAKGIPSFSFLYEDEIFMSNAKGDRLSSFGYRYAGLLVSDMRTNDNWWKWSYKNLEKDLKSNGTPLSETFKDRNITTSSQIPNSANSLRDWCRDVYEVNTHSHSSFDAPIALFNNTSIWKYCSPIQQVPVSLETSGVDYPERTVAKVIGRALLALDGNERIWHYRNKFFTGLQVDKFTEESSHVAFREGRKSGKHVKDICSSIYKNDITTSGVHSDFSVFCSLGQTP